MNRFQLHRPVKMHWRCALVAAIVGVTFSLFAFEAIPAAAKETVGEPALSRPALNPTELQDRAMQVMETYCAACHGPEKQEGDIRFDALEAIDPVDQQRLFGNAKEVLHLHEMPPEEAKQPSDAERADLMQWLESRLTGDAAKALEEKLLRFEYGNVVNHDDLFSGAHANLPASSPDRRWLISEYIFNEKVNRLLDYRPSRTIYGKQLPVQGDSGVHWSPKTEHGNKFRRTITNPFLLPKKDGVRYSGHEALTAGHLLTMIGNAKIIAGHMSSEATMKAHYPAMYEMMKVEIEHRNLLRSRAQFLNTYTYMDRLLKDIYGSQHYALLPEVKRVDVRYPDPVIKNGKVHIEPNLGLLGRMDKADLEAVFRGIHAYHGEGVEFDRVIEQSEREWVLEGVVESRIRNRVSMMKAFVVAWDFQGILAKASNGQYARPKYVPLNDAEMATIAETIKKHRKKGDTYQDIIDTCMTDWEASLKNERDAMPDSDEAFLPDLVAQLFERIFERKPTEAEVESNISMLESFMDKLGRQDAIAKLIESMILSTEFVYRYEYGQGEADAHGRRMMSPRDASYALAYALTDSSPDAELVQAVAEGRLSTREDYEREVRRMVKKRDVWTIIDEGVQAANLNASVTNQPIRKLRFFREFFGYPKAMSVFKDDFRFGAGPHEPALSRLVDEADLLVEDVLAQDQDVFETLLTTDRFYVYHNGDSEAMQAVSDLYRVNYEYFKQFDWKAFTPEDLAAHAPFMTSKGIKELKEYRPGNEKKTLDLLKRFMTTAELQFGAGQANATPFMFVGYGFWAGGNVLGRTNQQMRGEQVTSYWNIDWRTWDYPAQQPAVIPNRKGILTHPAWLIANSQNLETDPIHRGKWVREKLLAGTIPDVPITVDAVIPPDHAKTMRQRMEGRTGAEYCWRCHQRMDPLGFPFELYDDFGRYRTQENLEHPENLIKPAPKHNAPVEELTFGALLPVYKTLPVDARGVLTGTGDSKLDGDVTDAFDLIDRLAKSDKVRQSIIRHAFRYFLGRNETLADSKTLIDAEKAYLESDGSFDEVIVSLLTSDSFIYRKSPAKE
jgi:mono/diheme cytochrome c family protein